MLCRRCGEENPERARFCLACGSPLEAAAQQERKLVSVLFVDLVGFTGRSDRADPEDVRDMLEAYHAAAQREIEVFGGILEKFIGDAVMAVFGAPVSHGDDAERAVRAGLRVLELVSELDLEARAAVNTGEAVVSVGSSAAAGQALAMGDVVNTASRLQAAARPGRLLVGEETYRLTRSSVGYQALAPFAAKGKAKPISGWLAIGLIQTPAQPSSTPMVGRDRELELLQSIWERASRDRRPHMVTVLGPPGIGKSRLQREFSHRLQEAGAMVLRGRCLPYGERAAYGAFAQLVRGVAGIFENDSPDEARRKLRTTVEGQLPQGEWEETTRFVSILAGVGGEEPPMQRDFLFFAARRFLEGMAAARPLLVVFEDLHWAESGQLDLIKYLAAHVREVPLMQLGLARPEFFDQRSGWGGRLTAHTAIELEPLSGADSAALAEGLLADTGGVKDAIARLAQAAEGNPLFVEELAAALVEGHELEELPTSVRAAIASRLDALSQEARALLLDASVIGRHFWKGGLVAMGWQRDLDSILSALETRDFIRRIPSSRVKGDLEYLFKHVLIRDVAYATLPRALRRERHAAVARYIEAAAGDTKDLAALLAHHWREAGEPARAIDYLTDAAEQAAGAWALPEAVALYGSALELVEDDQQRRRLELARGIARSRLDDHETAFQDLARLIPELSGHDRVEGLLAWTWASQWTEHGDEAVAGSQEALELARSVADRELEAVATAHLSQGLAMKGDLDRAGELARQALEIWVPGTREWDLAQHRHLYGEQLYWLGRFEDAAAVLDEALQAIGDPQSMGAKLRTANNRARILCSLGRYEEGLALFDQTLHLARELGREIRIIQNYSTLPLRDLFDVEEARRRSQDSYEASLGRPGWGMPRAMAATDLVMTAILAGDPVAAETTWRPLWQAPEEIPNDWTRWLVRGRLATARAEMAMLMGNSEEATEWARIGIEAALPVHRLKYEVLSRVALGRGLLGMGKAADAAAELRLATEKADRLGTPAQRWPAWAAFGDALYATGDDEGAERAFAEALGIINGMAASLKPERATKFLAAEQVREVLGRAPQISSSPPR